MMQRFLLGAVLAAGIAQAAPELKSIAVYPDSFVLSAIPASQTLVVMGVYSDGSEADVTSQATLQSLQPAILAVGGLGRVEARSDGTATVLAKVGRLSETAAGEVKGGGGIPPFSFDADIAPVFSKRGCTQTACHGAINGQNGFRLSQFGYDPAADYEVIVTAAEGRRINLNEPEQSLILQKPTFQVPHGGGVRFETGSEDYIAILNWIQQGAPKGEPGSPLVSLKVFPPGEVFLTSLEQKQQLVVVGVYADGSQRDLTTQVNYHANDDTVAAISATGLLEAKRSGETAVMIRSLGAVGAARVAVSLRPAVAGYQRPPSNNFIDDFIFRKLEKLRIVPSGLSTDSEFLRRVYLDVMATLPTPAEARAFLADRSPDKRSRLIDGLFERIEYADYWSLKWGDQLTNSPEVLFNGTGYFQMWLRKALADNMPYDEYATALLTSGGSRYAALPTSYYGSFKAPLELAAFTSQTFMGVSLECARCHDHPNEKWRQSDFNGLAGFFGQVKRKAGLRGNESMIYVDPNAEYKHPDTNEVLKAKFPGASEPVEFEPGEDRRERLARWLTAPDNPYFTPAIVNRIWKEFLGEGLVVGEDFRASNPASHPELLDKLGADFRDHGYDLRHLMKRILNSRMYQLSSRVNETNKDDEKSYSHYAVRRLTAEQLLDGISQATLIPERFPAFPMGKRAIQLPDELVESYFLETFDRPQRQAASCTRVASPKMTQALHLASGDAINGRLADERNRLARLLAEGKADREIVEELTLAAVSRYPTELEYGLAAEAVRRAADRRRGMEDFFWALLNSKEFLYTH
jgi:hypothetical protein